MPRKGMFQNARSRDQANNDNIEKKMNEARALPKYSINGTDGAPKSNAYAWDSDNEEASDLDSDRPGVPEMWDSNNEDASDLGLEDNVPAPPSKSKFKAPPRPPTPSSGDQSSSDAETSSEPDDDEVYPEMVGKSVPCGAPRPKGKPNCTQQVIHTGRAPFGCRYHPNHRPGWVRDVTGDAGSNGRCYAGKGRK